MIKIGLYVDLNWYNQTKKLLRIVDGSNEGDKAKEIIEKICIMLNDN